MTHTRVLEQLLTTVAAVSKGHTAIDETTELTGDLHLESLQIMNLLLSIEDQFDISIPVNVLADVRTIGDLARHIEEQVGQR